jgi:hypothetical protein
MQRKKLNITQSKSSTWKNQLVHISTSYFKFKRRNIQLNRKWLLLHDNEQFVRFFQRRKINHKDENISL